MLISLSAFCPNPDFSSFGGIIEGGDFKVDCKDSKSLLDGLRPI